MTGVSHAKRSVDVLYKDDTSKRIGYTVSGCLFDVLLLGDSDEVAPGCGCGANELAERPEVRMPLAAAHGGGHRHRAGLRRR